MQPTLADIARETQTSVSTVSRVLAGGALAQRIGEATRGRVLAAARRMGYRPNLVARSLRTRRSNTVALLVSDIANPWFGRLASLIEQSLHRHGYSLILCNSGEDLATEAEYLKLLPQRGIDALILVPLAQTREALLGLLPAGLPLVLLDRPIPGIDHTVASDQDHLTGLLCDALDRANIRQVALVSGPEHVVTHRQRAEGVANRFEVIARHQGTAQPETGRAAWAAFERLAPPAIVCTNNFLGQGVIEAIGSAERPAEAERTVIGCFDGLAMMRLLPMPVVCVNQDVPLLAEACVNQVLGLLADTAAQERLPPPRGQPSPANAAAIREPAAGALGAAHAQETTDAESPVVAATIVTNDAFDARCGE